VHVGMAHGPADRVGAYQLTEALRASDRLATEKSSTVSFVSSSRALSPFPGTREEGEATWHRRSFGQAVSPERVSGVSHPYAPEPLLGVVSLDRCRAGKEPARSGYINHGGTLDLRACCSRTGVLGRTRSARWARDAGAAGGRTSCIPRSSSRLL